MITSITMIMEMIAATWNVGEPKWNGVEMANVAASPTRLKSSLPKIAATMAPRNKPARIAIRLKKPPRKR